MTKEPVEIKRSSKYEDGVKLNDDWFGIERPVEQIKRYINSIFE